MLNVPASGSTDVSASAEIAEGAGLVFVSETEDGIKRFKRGSSFSYAMADGKPLKTPATLARIRGLAIPPAWTDVWISPLVNGHIQATGRDAKGRKQYRYHADWGRVRDEAKYTGLLSFGDILPDVRDAIRGHMAERGLGRQRVLATVVHLLDTTLIRVGNREYARTNNSFGLTTLQDHHVSFSGSEMRFQFRGKTGKEWRLKVSDRRITRIVKSCQDLPGQHLFQYADDNGSVRQVSSSDVNAYLRELAGADVSAKMFRTWAGTVLAAMALRDIGNAGAITASKRNIKRAIEAVAGRLGNTAAICRKCYIHPEVIGAYTAGELHTQLEPRLLRAAKQHNRRLPVEEAAILAFLRARLK